MPSFEDILDQPFEAPAERPKPIPVGTYSAIVFGPPEFGESSAKKTPQVKFTLKLTAAQDDVDEDALEEMGGIADRTVTATYYFTEGSLYRLDEFFEHCGLDFEQAKKRKMTRRQMCESLQNSDVMIYIRHRPSQDGKSFFAEVANTAAA